MDNKQRLTEGVIWKKLLGFFFPILFGMLFQQLYNTVDAIIVGQFVGTSALAAVGGSSAQILNLVLGFFNGLASGATVIISQFCGAKDDEEVSRAVHTAIAFCLAAGTILTFFFNYFAPQLLQLMKDPEDIIGLSTEYLRIYAAGTIPLMLFNIGSGILRAVGDSKRPLYYLAACCTLNIALDLLFVCVFGMGVGGAAWATVISLAISSVLVMRCLMRSNAAYKLVPSRIKFYRVSLRKIMAIGVPAGVQASMYAISNLVIQTVVNGFGTVTVAAWTATGRFDGIFWVTSTAFGTAITAFVGQCYGAGLFDRMEKSIKTCFRIAFFTSIAFSVLILSVSSYGLRIITKDPEVIEAGVVIFRYFAPFYCIWIIVEIYSSSLRGMGDSFVPMIISVLGVCVFRILWMIFILPLKHTIGVMSLSYVSSWTITAIAILIYYGKKKKTLLLQAGAEKLPA